ncbi:hypothetical protein [Lentzea aerocolonigenes]|uniref:hypothetical protein n=1 Tax=Lentzea aerocolonigenes TaxID=68170 RepID=UPI0004C36031|nr:hypothetical protein [Lentzea aerocolonigenes]MCP2243202.1 hypothetical protein [Lentzea aerocolonigenes]
MTLLTVTLPLGCTEVKIVRPEDGTEMLVQLPVIEQSSTEDPSFTPEVLDRFERYRRYDRKSPAPDVAEFLVRDLGFEVEVPPSKASSELRFIYTGSKRSATLWLNSAGLFSIAKDQFNFAMMLGGAVPKAENRIMFPFESSDPREIAKTFVSWANGEEGA